MIMTHYGYGVFVGVNLLPLNVMIMIHNLVKAFDDIDGSRVWYTMENVIVSSECRKLGGVCLCTGYTVHS